MSNVYDVIGVALESAYDIDGVSLPEVYDINGTAIPFEHEIQWLDTAVITALPTISVTGVKQGGCTDGTYLYQCSGDSSNYSYMTVIKYKISDGTYTSVTFNGTPNFGHANDMTYNPITGYLYICTMLDDGSIIVLDADDLSYVETIHITNYGGNPYRVWQFCYDRNLNVYYSSVSATSICVYDSNWNCIEQKTIADIPTATMQGSETDGTYYYRILYNPNIINVVDLTTGELVKNITNPVSNEPEAIMYDWNGNYYFSGYKTPSLFYRLKMFE